MICNYIMVHPYYQIHLCMKYSITKYYVKSSSDRWRCFNKNLGNGFFCLTSGWNYPSPSGYSNTCVFAEISLQQVFITTQLILN